MALPAATATEIKAGALRKLGALAAGETASSEDDTLAGDTLDRLLDDLETRRDIAFTKEYVPEDAVLGLTEMLASALTDSFGTPIDRADRLRLSAEAARREFRARASARSASEPVKFTNY